jgi:hypothetical protein
VSGPAAIEVAPPRTAAFAFIFVTILLDMLASGAPFLLASALVALALVIAARTLGPK